MVAGRGRNRKQSTVVPFEVPQPSAKSQEAVDKLVSYMKAKAAKNPPEPKEPKGPRVRGADGRFAGVRVNEEAVRRLPTSRPSGPSTTRASGHTRCYGAAPLAP